MSRLTLGWVVAGALLAVFGLMIGATSQHEEFLEVSGVEGNQPAAAGNWIIVTALLVALGACMSVVALSRRLWRHRVLPGLGVLVAVYALATLVQSAFVNVDAVTDYRIAQMSISPIIHDETASPSIALGVMATFAAALLVLAAAIDSLLLRQTRTWTWPWQVRAAWPPGQPTGLTPREAMKRQAGATALAVPFLAVASLGSIRVLLSTSSTDPGAGLALILMPLAVLACMALLLLAVAKTWHLASFIRDGRLADVAEEAWTGFGRAEMAAVVLLGAVAIASSLLPLTFIDDLALGRTLVISIRAHGQGLMFVLVALVPSLLLHPHTVRCFDEYRGHNLAPNGSQRTLVGLLAMTVAAFVLGAATTFLAEGAMWPWLATLLPATIAASTLGNRRSTVLLLLLLAYAFWGVGNSVRALFDGQGPVAGLDFAVAPSILSLWRLLGAAAVALAVAKAAGAIKGDTERRTTIPITAGAALGSAAVCLLELPLSAWVIKANNLEYLGIGSVVASQSAGIAWTMHAMALGFGALFAYCLARLHRPDWFQPPTNPIGAPAGSEA